MKRGAKAAIGNNIMPVEEIASKLGISTETVKRTLSSAVRKLKRKGAFEIILPWVQASAAECDLLQAGSAECHPQWINLWSGRYK